MKGPIKGGMSRAYQGGIFRARQGHIKGISRAFKGISREAYHGHIKGGISREAYQGHIKGTSEHIKGISRAYQGHIQGISRAHQGTSRAFQGHIQGISRAYQGRHIKGRPRGRPKGRPGGEPGASQPAFSDSPRARTTVTMLDPGQVAKWQKHSTGKAGATSSLQKKTGSMGRRKPPAQGPNSFYLPDKNPFRQSLIRE